MKKQNYMDLTYPKLKYTEHRGDVKGMLVTAALFTSGYFLFIAIISLKLGFL